MSLSIPKDKPYVVGPRHRELEGFTVNRVWPTARRRLVGPFVFLDHLLLAETPKYSGLDVPPHPHIGLATVTWLFSGQLIHRDSLGVEQLIRPGDLNWMTAGRGITHSERSSPQSRAQPSTLHGVQCWVALPKSFEECEPTFEHCEAADIPVRYADGVEIRVIAGSAFDLEAPVTVQSPLFLVDARLAAGSSLELADSLGQRAIYIVSGSIDLANQRYESGQFIVWPDTQPLQLRAHSSAHLLLLGGMPLSEDRHIWWNFVASDFAMIEAAQQRWNKGDFPQVPGETEQMPMPRV